jgi:hypothetical protein
MSATTLVATNTQRLEALQRANEVRTARAAMKRRIATGEVGAAEAILSGDPEIGGMAVSEVLISQRSWGHVRCRRFLMSISLAENKTIASMTDRQRSLLASALCARPQ